MAVSRVSCIWWVQWHRLLRDGTPIWPLTYRYIRDIRESALLLMHCADSGVWLQSDKLSNYSVTVRPRLTLFKDKQGQAVVNKAVTADTISDQVAATCLFETDSQKSVKSVLKMVANCSKGRCCKWSCGIVGLVFLVTGCVLIHVFSKLIHTKVDEVSNPLSVHRHRTNLCCKSKMCS